MTRSGNHVLTTSDGRTLEARQDGVSDGVPVLFHAGTPSAASATPMLLEVARSRNLRVISYWRPGYGASSPRPGRRVADEAEDVAAVLDRCEVDAFVALGWSAGGPHALASAALVPGCRGAATVGGMAPYDGVGLQWRRGMTRDVVQEFDVAQQGDQLLEAFLKLASGRRLRPHAMEVAQHAGDSLSTAETSDLAEEISSYLAQVVDPLRLHTVAGWRDDDLALVSPWGFDVTAIDVPVSVWHGTRDALVPLAHARWLADRIPGARLHILDAENHLATLGRLDEVLDDLMANADPSPLRRARRRVEP